MIPGKIINYSFYTLFILTPLFWNSQNHELFEYNKMMLVYGLTTIITGAWIWKMIDERKLLIKRTILDIPLLLFLVANLISTIFSIDPHTSWWGYYSRSNGGLLSTISYLLLYWAFVSNIETLNQVLNFLRTAFISAVIISLWAIWEHFGVSVSCLMLRGQFNDNCWIQDVQARVFATLGQPNWLAAYLEMLIFPMLYFFISAKSKYEKTFYFITVLVFYTAFTFTYSRGATLGLIAGLVIFVGGYFLRFHLSGGKLKLLESKPLLGIIGTFLVINLLFGSALTNFKLISKFAPPPRPSLNLSQTTSTTQLENGGTTESGQIRLIVWKGALDIFRHYPLFGTGVETFAYSYYQFRPASHNLTSEWDFLYNKAHNEYLNYLATTGIVGLGSYLFVIGVFLIFGIRYIANIEHRASSIKHRILVLSLLASYIAYLIQNSFLFSVVTTALFFYLFPALGFVATGATRPFEIPVQLKAILSNIPKFLYRRPIYTRGAKILLIFSSVYILYSILQFWYADTLFSKGERNSEQGNVGVAYNLLFAASEINKIEPFYRSELGYAAATSATALQETDATLSAQLVEDADLETSLALKWSPKNVSFWRTAIRTYFELSTIDNKYIQKTLNAVDMSIKLAPTDPKLYNSKATILASLGKTEAAIQVLQQAIQLKPNYREAYLTLARYYLRQKQYPQSLAALKSDLNILPNDPEGLKIMAELEKMGFSTQSAETGSR